jgi:hypothetical protein
MDWEELFDSAAEYETTVTAIQDALADHRGDD